MTLYYYECEDCGWQGEKEQDLFMLPQEEFCMLCDENVELVEYEVDEETERLW